MTKYTTENAVKSCQRHTASIKTILLEITAKVNQEVDDVTNEAVCIFRCRSTLRKIERLFLEMENRLDEIIEPD